MQPLRLRLRAAGEADSQRVSADRAPGELSLAVLQARQESLDVPRSAELAPGVAKAAAGSDRSNGGSGARPRAAGSSGWRASRHFEDRGRIVVDGSADSFTSSGEQAGGSGVRKIS